MKTTNDGSADMVPTAEEMLEMLNVDVLPYFDDYDAESFSFSAKYRAVAVLSDNAGIVTVSLDNGSKIEVSKEYFNFPGAQKEIALSRVKNQLA